MLAPEKPERSQAYRLGGLALFFTTGVILAALAFEHFGGYRPCPLCMMQRYAYYAAIPALFVAMALSSEMPRTAALLFFLVSLAFLANAGLGVYHAGAEWKFWPGPATCAGALTLPSSAADLLRDLEASNVVRCDEAPWTFAGLSFAGWNVVASLVLFTATLKAAFLSAEQRD